MPLVRVNLARGKSPEYLRGVGDVIYDAMRATINVPENDRFQLFCEHAPGTFSVDRTYLDIARSDDWLIIEVTMSEGRTVEMKRAFYAAIVAGLHERLNVRKEDVFIVLTEVKKEDWSFGRGLAQYAL